MNAELKREAQDTLHRLTGTATSFRPHQWEAIEALVAEKQRVLLVQRTGFGKSAVYFIATSLLRARGAGPTLIISPLLALMRNQIDAAEKAGVHAVTLNSANITEWDEIAARINANEVDVLLVSPERLNNPDFRDTILPKLATTAGMVVVDEAHCISDWGHDFRPDYRRLRTLLTQLPPDTPVLATTATANERVCIDVAEQMGAGGQAPLTLRGSLARESLSLAVQHTVSDEQRLAWVDTALHHLSGSGIIYTLTVAAAEEIAAFLTSRGHSVASYTGRSESTERQEHEEALLHNRVKALVATSALGMGFDKPDLGFVLHIGAPSSPVAYYQQVGRAGRAVDRADVVLLPGKEDTAIWKYFASLSFPPEEVVQSILRTLAGSDAPLSVPALERHVDVKRSRLDLILKVLDVDGAVRRVRGGWEATGTEWRYDTERYERLAQARAREQQQMVEYLHTSECRSEFLRRGLDDPHAAACGRCDNCTGRRTRYELSAESRTAAAKTLSDPGVPLEVRRSWPAGMRSLGIELSGRIKDEHRAEEGYALGRLSDIGWGGPLRELFASLKPQQVSESMLNAIIEVLALWEWERPVAVAAVASPQRPQLTVDLAQQLARIGRMQYVGAVGRDPEQTAPEPAQNSAHRLRQAHTALCRDGLPVPDVPSAPLLLIDDVRRTGWTLALASKLLRDAGATKVYPFVLAIEG